MAIIVKIPALVTTLQRHTSDICTVTMKPLKLFPFYKPGQFLHFALDAYDPSFPWPESRVFSIASSPTNRDEIVITFTTKGNYTKRMYDTLKINDTVWLKLPYGEFVFDINIKSVFIAGGTGITPFISHLAYLIDKQIHHSPIELHYGVRENNQTIYKNIIEKAKLHLKDFDYMFYCENISTNNDSDTIKGIININAIYQSNKNTDCNYYISGPINMINNFKSYLFSNGINEKYIKTDNWS